MQCTIQEGKMSNCRSNKLWIQESFRTWLTEGSIGYVTRLEHDHTLKNDKPYENKTPSSQNQYEIIETTQNETYL